MKTVILCMMLLIMYVKGFNQQPMLDRSLSQQHYLDKSKAQKTTALILVGSGVVLEVAGIIAYQHGNAVIFLLGAGLLSQVASIPFFISSAINKSRSRKASLAFELDDFPNIHSSVKSFRAIPSISFKLNL